MGWRIASELTTLLAQQCYRNTKRLMQASLFGSAEESHIHRLHLLCLLRRCRMVFSGTEAVSPETQEPPEPLEGLERLVVTQENQTPTSGGV